MSGITNLQVDLLRTFVSVVELGGQTKVGAMLGRSQPAISLQLGRLEELVGAPLLLVAAAGTLFGIIDQVSPVGFLSALLIAAWEIGLGFWLVIKGFNPDAVERLEMRELVEVG